MRFAGMITIMICVSCGCGWTADSFVGSWKLNASKSHLPGAPEHLATAIDIARQEGAMGWDEEGLDSRGKPRKLGYGFNAIQDSVELPDGHTLLLRRINDDSIACTRKHNGKIIGTEQRVISQDGTKLMIIASGTKETGEGFYVIAVYDRQ